MKNIYWKIKENFVKPFLVCFFLIKSQDFSFPLLHCELISRWSFRSKCVRWTEFPSRCKYWQRSHHIALLNSCLDWKNDGIKDDSNPKQATYHDRLVVISPPEIRSKQWLISPNHLQVLRELFHWAEVLSVYITVGRSYGWHVGSIEHHWYHVVGENPEKLLCHVVLRKE